MKPALTRGKRAQPRGSSHRKVSLFRKTKCNHQGHWKNRRRTRESKEQGGNGSDLCTHCYSPFASTLKMWGPWRLSSGTLEPDCQGLNPGSVTQRMWDLREVVNLPVPLVSSHIYDLLTWYTYVTGLLGSWYVQFNMAVSCTQKVQRNISYHHYRYFCCSLINILEKKTSVPNCALKTQFMREKQRGIEVHVKTCNLSSGHYKNCG